MNEYGLLLKTKGREGSVVAHEKYTGSNTQTQLSDSNYERVEITASNKTTNQLKEKYYHPPKWLMGNEIWYSPKKRGGKNG